MHPFNQTTVAVYQRHQASTAHIVIAWIFAVLTVFYMLPWAIAATRSKRNIAPIVLINIFLGWSLIGWIAAMIMACLNDPQPRLVAAVTIGAYGYPPAAPCRIRPSNRRTSSIRPSSTHSRGIHLRGIRRRSSTRLGRCLASRRIHSMGTCRRGPRRSCSSRRRTTRGRRRRNTKGRPLRSPPRQRRRNRRRMGIRTTTRQRNCRNSRSGHRSPRRPADLDQSSCLSLCDDGRTLS